MSLDNGRARTRLTSARTNGADRSPLPLFPRRSADDSCRGKDGVFAAREKRLRPAPRYVNPTLPDFLCLNLDPFAARRFFSVMGHVVSDRTMQQEPASGCGTTWYPLDAFQSGARCEYAVIVLNRPIYWRHDVLLRFWQKARITVTVDGGTQRWLKYLEEQGIDLLSGEHDRYIPDLITGDMDSCSPSVIEKLGSIGSTVVETPDQNHTDYTKALLQVAYYAKTRNINLGEIYVLAETSGRFDHIIGNINTLYKSDKLVGNIRVIQVASNSLTWLLKPGLHSIHIPEILVRQKSWCGLLPFGCPVNCISTTGLKWNLSNTTTQFGGLISTSNTYENSEVTVNTDTSVIWTMGIEALRESINDETS